MERVIPVAPWTYLDMSGDKWERMRWKERLSIIPYKWTGNEIGDSGANEISESLKVNTTLTELYLGSDEEERNEKEEKRNRRNKRTDNRIGAEGASKVSESLKVNTTLTELNLSCDE